MGLRFRPAQPIAFRLYCIGAYHGRAAALPLIAGPAGSEAEAKCTLVCAGHALDAKTGKLADAKTIGPISLLSRRIP